MSNKTQFITRANLASRWDLSGMSIKRMEQRGILRPCKLGERVVRYKLEDIERIEAEATIDRSTSAA